MGEGKLIFAWCTLYLLVLCFETDRAKKGRKKGQSTIIQYTKRYQY
jgi:hypothetical protein